MSDLISRECAINAVALEIASMFDVTTYDGHEIAEHALSPLPSAEGGDAEMNEVKSPYMQSSPDGADLISRTDAIEAVRKELVCDGRHETHDKTCRFIADVLLSALPSAEAVTHGRLIDADALSEKLCETTIFIKDGEVFQRMINDAPTVSAEAVQGWIPCSERLPEDLEAVNVTWVNHNPPVYYQYTKDVPNADTAVYYRGVWYWWDSTICDVLGEYGEKCGAEQIDKDIEILAWMPLPKPYREEREVEE